MFNSKNITVVKKKRNDYKLLKSGMTIFGSLFFKLRLHETNMLPGNAQENDDNSRQHGVP